MIFDFFGTKENVTKNTNCVDDTTLKNHRFWVTTWSVRRLSLDANKLLHITNLSRRDAAHTY